MARACCWSNALNMWAAPLRCQHATSWIPGTERGLAVNPDDTPERVTTFLNHAVGERSDPAMRKAFIDNGPKAVEKFERETALQFQVRMLHPDYLSELEGSVLRGRAIEPQPFDGKLLGPNMTLVRPPIPEFTVLGGMMVDRDDIFHLLRLKETWASLQLQRAHHRASFLRQTALPTQHTLGHGQRHDRAHALQLHSTQRAFGHKHRSLCHC